MIATHVKSLVGWSPIVSHQENEKKKMIGMANPHGINVVWFDLNY